MKIHGHGHTFVSVCSHSSTQLCDVGDDLMTRLVGSFSERFYCADDRDEGLEYSYVMRVCDTLIIIRYRAWAGFAFFWQH